MQKIVFGLGSNLGNREFYLNRAIEFLTAQLSLTNIKKSAFFANSALLKEDAPKKWDLEFLNVAVSADIDLHKFSPEKILEITQSIEKQIGRKTNEHNILWAPREIDIDILAIGNLKIDLPQKLKIPHHALFEREFFLRTFSEIEKELLVEIAGNINSNCKYNINL